MAHRSYFMRKTLRHSAVIERLWIVQLFSNNRIIDLLLDTKLLEFVMPLQHLVPFYLSQIEQELQRFKVTQFLLLSNTLQLVLPILQ